MTTETISIEDFIKAHQIEMKATRISGRANKGSDGDWERTARHFSCTLVQIGKGNTDTLTVEFSQGSAHTKNPTAADVLDCLASDASGADNARSFEEWAGDYGYDVDSRRAEAIYKQIKEQAVNLFRFLGVESYHQLLDNVERL